MLIIACPVFASKKPAIPVQVALVKQIDFSPQFKTYGEIQSRQQVALKADYAGYVEQIDFKSGDYVKKGAPLITINRGKLTAKYLSQAAQFHDAQLHLERVSKLRAKGYASKTEYDTVVALFRKAKTALDVAQINLKHSMIRAPFDGYLGIRKVSVGDYVQPSTMLVTLSALKHVRVLFDVPQQLVHQVRVGDRVDVYTDLSPNNIYHGKVYAFNDQFSKKIAALSVLADINNDDLKLRPLAYVNVRLFLGASKKVIVIPQFAVRYTAISPYVYVIENGHAKQLNVSLGQQIKKGMVIVKKGLKLGQRVVVSGSATLLDGDAVTIQKNDEQEQRS